MSSRRRPLFASRKRRTWKRSALIVALIVNGALAMTWFALDWIVPERSARTARDHGPVHVHGLGMNPKDQGLFLTTHTGLWRVAADDGKATRVAERREDIMGFTVEGSDRFLGSGHPDLRDNLPPLLGLIRSRDSGRNWTRVSSSGRSTSMSSGGVASGSTGLIHTGSGSLSAVTVAVPGRKAVRSAG